SPSARQRLVRPTFSSLAMAEGPMPASRNWRALGRCPAISLHGGLRERELCSRRCDARLVLPSPARDGGGVGSLGPSHADFSPMRFAGRFQGSFRSVAPRFTALTDALPLHFRDLRENGDD